MAEFKRRKKGFSFAARTKRGPSVYTKEQVQQALDAVKEGKEVRVVAQECKMKLNSLMYYINTRKIKLKSSQTQRKKYTLKDKDEFCSCCGIRPKAPGNRFLCSICYQFGGD